MTDTLLDDELESFILVVNRAGERLDKWLTAALPQHSRSVIQRWISDSRVTVAGHVVKASYRMQTGDQVQVDVPPLLPMTMAPENIPLTIVYEDADLLLIDKPAGLVVHPAPGHPGGTLVNALLYHVPDLAGIGGEIRPGIVHRLDKDTSGLLLVAKNDKAQRELQRQFKERLVHKVYLALLDGILTPRQGTIDAPIGRDPRNRQRMAVITGQESKQARPAVTDYRVRAYYDGFTLVEAEPHTGRTHQIRVHFHFIGFPLVADAVYGHRKPRVACPRQFLHAHILGFRRPSDGAYVEFSSPLPADLQAVLDGLET